MLYLLFHLNVFFVLQRGLGMRPELKLLLFMCVVVVIRVYSLVPADTKHACPSLEEVIFGVITGQASSLRVPSLELLTCRCRCRCCCSAVSLFGQNNPYKLDVSPQLRRDYPSSSEIRLACTMVIV